MEQGFLKEDDVYPGSCISADHYFSPVQGRLLHTFGRERHGYTCGSLFVDHASRKISNFPQFSTNATETLKSVVHLKAYAYNEGFKIRKYHSDNGIFSMAEFKAHCETHNIKYKFSGVDGKFSVWCGGTKHKNCGTMGSCKYAPSCNALASTSKYQILATSH
jgi:hypothetical protein